MARVAGIVILLVGAAGLGFVGGYETAGGDNWCVRERYVLPEQLSAPGG